LKAADVGAKIAGAYLGGVRRCYLAALAKQPRARGALSLAFTVNAVGKTTMITVKGFDDGVAGCVAKLVNDWRFAIPQSPYAEPRNARFSIGLALEP
jgi:fluoride ion exporter CrcB/FEX